MHKAVGNVEYDKDAALYPGLVYEPCDTHPTGGATELMLLDLEDVTEDSDDDVKPDNEDTQAVYSSREWEAAMIAEKSARLPIQSLVFISGIRSKNISSDRIS